MTSSLREEPVTVSKIDAHDPLAPLQHADRIIVARPFRLIGPQIFISVPLPGSRKPDQPVLYGKHKFSTIRADIRFRLLPTGKPYLFRIRSTRRWFNVQGRYDVLDAEDNPLGLVDKSVRRSQARSHYRLFDAAGNQVLEGEESTMSGALSRRIWDFLRDSLPGPFELAPDMPDHFDLYLARRRVGRYERMSLAYDWSLLEVGPELAGMDRRLLVAFVAALDEL
jgi:hypothetical protein